MKKLLVICGPTATGKTQLALDLAYQFGGELISSDSRQVYKDLDILTGKDIPSGFQWQKSHLTHQHESIGYYGNGTKIWLTDLVSVDQPFHVSWYTHVAFLVLHHLWDSNVLPIAVGGSGLYLKAITQSLSQIHIPPNQQLREKFRDAPRQVLQKELRKIDKEKWESMNQSDRNNPRRLIRAIEITHASHQTQVADSSTMDILWVGLTAPLSFLEQAIEQRVVKRWQQGVADEVAQLKSDVAILGYSLIKQYIQGKLSKEETLRLWMREERQYAKRQLTWFKKQSSIHWYDVTQEGYKKKITQLVSAWYTRGT